VISDIEQVSGDNMQESNIK